LQEQTISAQTARAVPLASPAVLVRALAAAAAVAALAALAAFAPACTSVENAPDPGQIATLDEPYFRCAVEPILLRDCAYNGCHGQASAPLRLYSIGKLRLGASATLAERTAPLTAEERHLNFLGAQAFDFGDVDSADNLLVRKPLPSSAGGFEHLGGAVWTGAEDPRVRTIRNWLDGGKACP
jgi:hypothetical protein